MYGRGESRNLGSKSKIPGPGAYPQIGINPEGKYTFSKYKNSMGIIWGSSKEKRFRYKDFKKYLSYKDSYIPGPGKYEIKQLITGQGNIFNSKFKSSMAKTMSGRFMEPTSKLKSKLCY